MGRVMVRRAGTLFGPVVAACGDQPVPSGLAIVPGRKYRGCGYAADG